jgi:hypothetical protein
LPLKFAPLEIGEHLRPYEFAFANHHCIGVLHHFVGKERRVRTANHYGDFAFAELPR